MFYRVLDADMSSMKGRFSHSVGKKEKKKKRGSGRLEVRETYLEGKNVGLSQTGWKTEMLLPNNF